MDVFLRKAEEKDARFLYDLRNDEEVRKYSFQKDFIEYESHLVWYHEKLTAEDVLFFILTDGECNLGQIRVDIVGMEAVLSYAIDRVYRGKGYGTHIIKLVEMELKQRFSHILIKAEVLVSNIKSRQIFVSLGYCEKVCTEDVIEYRKQL